MKRMVLSLLALTLCCVVFAHAQVWPEENHYKVYKVDEMYTFLADIELLDQFGEHYMVNELFLEKFANPVEKNQEPILFPEVHQTWWRVNNLTQTRWSVRFSNQFGSGQIWEIDGPQYLVLPARKYDPGPLLQHNHYLAYQATTGTPLNETVSLVDQFGSVVVDVLEPLYFLNPVEKWHDSVHFPILDPAPHLACYRIDPMTYNIQVTAFDQFGVWGFQIGDQDCLCVPSWKDWWFVPTEARSWSEIKNLYRD